MRWLKRLGICLGIALSIGVLTVFGGVFYLKTDHARVLLIDKLNSLIKGSFFCRSIRFSLLQGQLEITGLALDGPGSGHVKEHIAGLDRFFIDISWPSLLRGKLVISSIVIERPWCALQMDELGQLNFARALGLSPETDSEFGPINIPVTIRIVSLSLLQGAFSYENPADNLCLAASGIDVVAKGELRHRTGVATLVVARTNFDTSNVHLGPLRVDLKTTFINGMVEPFSCKVLTGESNLKIDGNAMDIFGTPRFQKVGIDVLFSLEDLRKIFPILPASGGLVVARIDATGSPKNPNISIRGTYNGGTLLQWPIKAITIDAQLDDRRVTLDNLGVNIAKGHIGVKGRVDLRQIFPTGFWSEHKELDNISYDLRLMENDVRISDLVRGMAYPDGKFDSLITVNGQGVSLGKAKATLAADVHGDDVKIRPDASAFSVRVTTKAGIEGGKILLHPLTINTPASANSLNEITINGKAGLLSDYIELDVSAHLAEVASVFSSLGLRGGARGNLQLDGHVAGSRKRPAMRVMATGRGLGYEYISIGELDLSADLDKSGNLTVSRLLVRNEDSEIEGTASGQLSPGSYVPMLAQRFDLSLVFRQVNLCDALGRQGPCQVVEGPINGTLHGIGPLKDLWADLSMRGEKVKIGHVQLGNVDLDATLSGGTVHVSRAVARKGPSMALVSGIAKVLQAGQFVPAKEIFFDAQVDGDTLSLAEVNDRFSGDVSLCGRVAGTAANLQISSSLSGTDLDFGVQKFKAAEAAARFEGLTLSVDSLRALVAPGEEISGHGWYSFSDRDYEVDVHSQGVSFNNVDAIRKQGAVDGKFAGHISGAGTLDHPWLDGSFTLNNSMLASVAGKDVQVCVSLEDQVARIEGHAGFDVSGTYDLGQKDYSLSCVFNNTDLRPYLNLAGRHELEGSLTGTIEAKGNATEVKQTQATVDLSDLTLRYKDSDIAKIEGGKIVAYNGEASTPGLHVAFPDGGYLDVIGHVREDGPVAIEAFGRVPLSLARYFVNTSISEDLSGELALSVDVDGALPHPDVRADVDLKRVAFTVPKLYQRLEDLEGRIKLNPQVVSFEKLEGRLDTGRFELSGTIDLKDFKPTAASIDLNAVALPVRIPDTMDMTLNTELFFRGTPTSSTVSGKATILEGVYYKDMKLNLNLLEQVTKKKRKEAPPPREVTNPFLKNMALDIVVEAGDYFRVENNMAHLNVTPDLQIGGVAAKPTVLGRTSVESGTITFRNNTFNVLRGVVDFSNPYKVDPVLDIEGEAKIRQWSEDKKYTINVSVSGPADNLVVKLTSNPPAEEADIISLLITGKTTGELMGQDAGNTAKTPAQMVAEMVGSTFSGDFKKVTGLDVIEVEAQGADSGAEAGGRTSLTLGKELSRRMTLKYVVESKGGETMQIGVADYKLLEDLLFEAFQGSYFGGGLKFRLEYR